MILVNCVLCVITIMYDAKCLSAFMFLKPKTTVCIFVVGIVVLQVKVSEIVKELNYTEIVILLSQAAQ